METAAPNDDDIAALRRLVGPAGLVLAAARRGYETPARYAVGAAAVVVRPSSVERVAGVMSYCMGRRLRVVPQGANTGLVLGGTPDGSGRDIVLSCDRLRTIHHVNPQDRTVSADAGVRLSELNAALDPHGLFLPIDLGADPMLGGMAATNTGGARFLRYGDMRAQILGLQVVLATEAAPVVTLGSGLRKDNTRLSLKDLVVGGGAAFGVITGVKAKVAVRPVQIATALLMPSHAERCSELVLRLERSAGELLSAMEGMSGAAMRHALAHAPALRNPFGASVPDYAVLLELSTTVSTSAFSLDDVLLDVLSPMLGDGEGLLDDAIVAPPSALWALRHSLSEGLRRAGDVIGIDLAFSRDQVFRFRTAALQRLAGLGASVEVCDFGHVADGGVHFNLVVPRDCPVDERVRIRRALVDLAVRDFGGSFSAEHGLGRANQGEYDRYVPREERELAGLFTRTVGVGPCGHVRLGPPPVRGDDGAPPVTDI